MVVRPAARDAGLHRRLDILLFLDEPEEERPDDVSQRDDKSRQSREMAETCPLIALLVFVELMRCVTME